MRQHSIYIQLILPTFLYVFTYFLSPYLPHLKINVTQPYNLEKSLFNIHFLDKTLTINEWIQLHSSLPLDIIASISYISFFFIFVIIAIYLYLSVSYRHPNTASPPIGWALFWLGIAYLITAHLYPVAPPWYVTEYGLSDSINQLHVHAHAIGCDNFDAFIHYQLCEHYIGNGPYPFGAMPSTHVGIPLLLVYYAFKYQKLKSVCIVFYILEVFSTVYLNQHYVIDLIVGSLYALIIAICVDYYYKEQSYAKSLYSSDPLK